MFYRKRKKELLKEAAKKVMPILKKHPDLCILFAYDILALTYYFFDNKINIERFPICICGRNKNTTAKIVANIFCNMQFFDPCKPNTIPSKTNIHYTRAVILISLCLIPVANGLYKRKDHTLIKIISETTKDKINYFPVFVTEKEPNIMEIININISNFDEFPGSKNLEDICDLKISINRLLLEYIIFLYKLKNHHLPRHLHIETLIKLYTEKQQNKLKNLTNIDDNIEGQYLLYIKAMTHFNEFLKWNSCEDIAKELNILCFEVFKMRISDSVNAPISENVILESFKKYISSIFLDKTLPPYYFYTEGIEKRGKRETCYYLEFCHFYSDFCNKNIGIAIDE